MKFFSRFQNFIPPSNVPRAVVGRDEVLKDAKKFIKIARTSIFSQPQSPQRGCEKIRVRAILMKFFSRFQNFIPPSNVPRAVVGQGGVLKDAKKFIKIARTSIFSQPLCGSFNFEASVPPLRLCASVSLRF